MSDYLLIPLLAASILVPIMACIIIIVVVAQTEVEPVKAWLIALPFWFVGIVADASLHVYASHRHPDWWNGGNGPLGGTALVGAIIIIIFSIWATAMVVDD